MVNSPTGTCGAILEHIVNAALHSLGDRVEMAGFERSRTTANILIG